MQESAAVRGGILRFYERFSSGDKDAFAEGISTAQGASVIGSAPEEGHDDRESWIAAYAEFMPELGLRLEGTNPRGYEEGGVGWGTDTPSFVMPDGSRLPTRMTGVLRHEDGEWKVVHLHFSVGVPDEEAMQPASSAAA